MTLVGITKLQNSTLDCIIIIIIHLYNTLEREKVCGPPPCGHDKVNSVYKNFLLSDRVYVLRLLLLLLIFIDET